MESRWTAVWWRGEEEGVFGSVRTDVMNEYEVR